MKRKLTFQQFFIAMIICIIQVYIFIGILVSFYDSTQNVIRNRSLIAIATILFAIIYLLLGKRIIFLYQKSACNFNRLAEKSDKEIKNTNVNLSKSFFVFPIWNYSTYVYLSLIPVVTIWILIFSLLANLLMIIYRAFT